MYEFHQVSSVTPMEGLILRVVFQDGTSKDYDVAPWMERQPVFQELKNNAVLFANVHVDQGGYGISWNDSIDLHCNELWQNGVTV